MVTSERFLRPELQHLAKLRMERFRALLKDYRETWGWPAGKDAFLTLWEKSR